MNRRAAIIPTAMLGLGLAIGAAIPSSEEKPLPPKVDLGPDTCCKVDVIVDDRPKQLGWMCRMVYHPDRQERLDELSPDGECVVWPGE